MPSGTLIGDRYRIVRDLGSGGMGMVYQADDLTLNVPVALKFLTPSPANHHRRLELFLNEVRVARQIAHPNVCRIYDVGEIGGQHFISMEYVEGEDLASLLRRIGRLPKDKAINIGLEICQALEAAHTKGILHRDLKPANLMIDARGHAKIMDFGLAVFSRSPASAREIAGTPDYMAPEQRDGCASIQADIYAVGLILYELFTGRNARRDLVPREDAADRSPLPVPADDVDPLVERIIRHCVEPDPGLRPSSIGAVAAALARLATPQWYPAEGLEIPHRRHWRLERRLGRGGFGETWLGVHGKTHERRVFKFCHDPGKLRAFQREMTLFRFMREALGVRDDIAALLDWQLDEPPFFIESAFAPTGNLLDWIQHEGSVAGIPLEDRIEIIRRVALALAAAHSVGVLHKDVKPANVLVYRASDGALRVQLCDLGVGGLTEKERLNAAGLTAVGFTEDDRSSDAGTRMYMAPEIIEGKAPTTSADVYGLGVMLYQMVAGDLAKALASGWDRDVHDDLLREDIAVAVDGAPERRVTAAKFAEQLLSLPERHAARAAERERQERAEFGERAAHRRRMWATAALATLLVLSLGLGLAFERAENIARLALIDQTLRSNEAMVRLAAAAVADKLGAAIRRTEEAAADPALRDGLAQMTTARDQRTRTNLRETLQRYVDRLLLSGEGQQFSSWSVADKEGRVWARAPFDPVVIERNFGYREWFNGKTEFPPDARVEATPRRFTGFSHAFVSKAQTAPLLIALASPIVRGKGPDAEILGVLNAGIHLETFNAWLAVAENRPRAQDCPDRFILLLHRGELVRHPCPAADASPLPIRDFSNQPALKVLFSAPGQRTAAFRDPLQSSAQGSAGNALAVARSLDALPDWTLVLEQNVDAALRPITALTDDFHRPAHVAFVLGLGALVLLVGLLWWGGDWRQILRLRRAGFANAPTEKAQQQSVH